MFCSILLIYGEKKKKTVPAFQGVNEAQSFILLKPETQLQSTLVFFKLTSTFLFILFPHLGILLQMFLIGLQGYFWESEPRIKKRDVTYL